MADFPHKYVGFSHCLDCAKDAYDSDIAAVKAERDNYRELYDEEFAKNQTLQERNRGLEADLREYKNTADSLQELRAAQEEQLAQLRWELQDKDDLVTSALEAHTEAVQKLQAREREVIELKEAFIDVCYDMTGMPRERAEICLEDTLKHVATRVEKVIIYLTDLGMFM